MTRDQYALALGIANRLRVLFGGHAIDRLAQCIVGKSLIEPSLADVVPLYAIHEMWSGIGVGYLGHYVRIEYPEPVRAAFLEMQRWLYACMRDSYPDVPLGVTLTNDLSYDPELFVDGSPDFHSAGCGKHVGLG